MSRGRVILGIMFLLLLLRWCSSESTSILDPTGSGYEAGYDEGYEDGIAVHAYLQLASANVSILC